MSAIQISAGASRPCWPPCRPRCRRCQSTASRSSPFNLVGRDALRQLLVETPAAPSDSGESVEQPTIDFPRLAALGQRARNELRESDAVTAQHATR